MPASPAISPTEPIPKREFDIMLTIVCDEPGRLSAVQRDKPVRRDGEVLLRLRRIGICGTDIHIFAGNQPYLSYPRVMGHELAATVEEAPPRSALKPGDVVSIIPYLSCGACSACRKGLTNCCRNLAVLGVHRDGGMTGYLSLPESAVVKADGLTLDQAAMVEFLAIGAHAVSRSRVGQGDRALVVGAGPIGAAVAIFARASGASVTLLDTRADRLAFARDQLGFTSTVSLGPDTRETLETITDGDLFDVVFDATGSAKAIEHGFGFVGHGGTYVLVSIVASDITFSDPEFHKREISLLGSRNATLLDFGRVMQLMRAGEIPDAIITHRLALEEVPSIFPDLVRAEAGVFKALVDVGG